MGSLDHFGSLECIIGGCPILLCFNFVYRKCERFPYRKDRALMYMAKHEVTLKYVIPKHLKAKADEGVNLQNSIMHIINPCKKPTGIGISHGQYCSFL